MKTNKKNAGWSIKGRDFTPDEYENSFIKDSFKLTYNEYLEERKFQEDIILLKSIPTILRTNIERIHPTVYISDIIKEVYGHHVDVKQLIILIENAPLSALKGM